MNGTLSGAFEALEHELVDAAQRLSVQSARRRRRRTVGAVVISSLLAVTGAATASGLLYIPVSPGADPTANRAASAIGLSVSDAAVLLKAQQLGKVAKACQVAHGATPINGGLDDPGGVAAQACKSENDANEDFLNSDAFRAAMVAAQPKILEAARCFERYTGVHPGKVDPSRSGFSQAAIDAGKAACFQPNGLPK